MDESNTNVTPEIMQFVVFAIESAAEKMGESSKDIYNRLQKVGLIDNYLIKGYDMLHTQGKAYIADVVIEALHNWEEYARQKKGGSK